MKKAIIYALVVCAISWAAALTFCHICGYNGTQPSVTAQTFLIAYMFIPLLVALVMQLVGKGEKPFDNSLGLLRFRPRWSWAVGLLSAPVAVALCAGIASLFAEPISMADAMKFQITATLGASADAEAALAQIDAVPSWVMVLGTVVSGLIAGVSINAIAAFGEEYGWRYYLIGLLRSKKFLPAALFIGVVWGIWHAPAILLMGHNYPNDRALGVLMMVVMCVLLGIIELYFVVKSGTMWPAAIIHGTFNALSGLTVIWFPMGSATTTAMTGLAGFAAMAIIVAALWLYDRYISRERIFSATIEESLLPKNRQLITDN